MSTFEEIAFQEMGLGVVNNLGGTKLKTGAKQSTHI